MSVVTSEGNEIQGDGKIGTAPHGRRNLLLLFGTAAAVCTMVAYYSFLGRHDAVERSRRLNLL